MGNVAQVGILPRDIEVEVVESGSQSSSSRMVIKSNQCVHDLRCAVAEMKHISPHAVEVCGGLAKTKLGQNDSLLRWSSKGRISVTVTEPRLTFFTSSTDSSAKQYDAVTGECLVTYQHPAPVNSLCLSKCGCFLYTACDDGSCRKFDDSQDTVLKTYKGKGEPLVHVQISPCAKFLYTCTRTNVAEKFDEASGQLLCVFFEHVSGNPCLALSPCGTYIYKTTTNNVARKYNWQTGEVLATYGNDEEDTAVLGIALGCSRQDETLVFVARSDGSVNQFDESGAILRSYQCHEDRVTWIGCR